GAVISTSIGMTVDCERSAQHGRCVVLGQNLSILDGLNEPQACHLQRNSERQIVGSELSFEVRLRERTVGNRGIVGAPTYRPELMHSAIATPVRLVLEAHLANRTVLLLKGWDDVLSAEAVWYQSKLRILRLLRNRIARIRNDESARAA